MLLAIVITISAVAGGTGIGVVIGKIVSPKLPIRYDNGWDKEQIWDP